MTIKVGFTHGAFRTLEADLFTVDKDFVVFLKDEKPILTAVLRNTLFFEEVQPETSRQEPRHDLFSGLAR